MLQFTSNCVVIHLSICSLADDLSQNAPPLQWQVSCAAGQTASFTFTELDTELDYDFVTLYDGTSGSRQIDEVSGNLVDMATRNYRSTGAMLTLEFTSDDSIGARGFEGNYRCQSGGGAAAPPPPQATGEATNELPGKLVRGAQPSPPAL